jgi:hypothetical protein
MVDQAPFCPYHNFIVCLCKEPSFKILNFKHLKAKCSLLLWCITKRDLLVIKAPFFKK